MSEAMDAEFDTVATWTAEVATALGPDYALPAACRGSGSPPAIDWLCDAIDVRGGDVLVDIGAGIGGPAEYAARRRGAAPVLVEPQMGACRAADMLFGLPVVQASGSAVPLADGSADAVWSLGVLCTMVDQLGLLRELSRVVRPGGGIGLLVYTATTEVPKDQLPEGNSFPTPEALDALVRAAELRTVDDCPAVDLGAGSDDWQRRTDRVAAELESRYRDRPSWRVAERQSKKMGDLVGTCAVVGTLLHLRHRT